MSRGWRALHQYGNKGTETKGTSRVFLSALTQYPKSWQYRPLHLVFPLFFADPGVSQINSESLIHHKVVCPSRGIFPALSTSLFIHIDSLWCPYAFVVSPAPKSGSRSKTDAVFPLFHRRIPHTSAYVQSVSNVRKKYALDNLKDSTCKLYFFSCGW